MIEITVVGIWRPPWTATFKNLQLPCKIDEVQLRRTYGERNVSTGKGIIASVSSLDGDRVPTATLSFRRTAPLTRPNCIRRTREHRVMGDGEPDIAGWKVMASSRGWLPASTAGCRSGWRSHYKSVFWFFSYKSSPSISPMKLMTMSDYIKQILWSNLW